jgi:hypothetical protein
VGHHEPSRRGATASQPLLADFLEEGLSVLGVSCEEFEMGRL